MLSLLFFGLHIFVVLVSTFVGALVDISISWVGKEHPLPFGHQEHSARS